MRKVIVGTGGTSGTPEFAGSTWVRLQYALGLERLGLETYWVDRLPSIDPLSHPHGLEYLMERFRGTMSDFDLEERYCVVYDGGERYFGMDEPSLQRLVADADLLVNIGGSLAPDSPLMAIPRRAYVDVDPGFTQIWAHQTDIGLRRHNFFFTIGQNVGSPEFRIPTMDIAWRPILPPVVLDRWPPSIDESTRRLSTVADWRGSQNAIFEAEYYGTKREEFIRLLDVPLLAGQRIEVALTIGQHDFEDLGLLLGHDWRVRDPAVYAGDTASYREFIQRSKAEFSVAKAGYVKANSGWISDRTACYLASGKPAIVESTGVEGHLPTGKGLLTFRTVEEAVAAITAVNDDYLSHCRAARQLAEERFDSDRVLTKLLEGVGM